MNKEISKLQKQNMFLLQKHEEQSNFIETLVVKCLPIANEISMARGWFKVFKIVKLAIYLAKTLIQIFDNKPNPNIDWD